MPSPRIVSLVPSWTETLIEAGCAVVGRTRYCLHPADQVAKIPIVGGTKSFDREKLNRLQPDFVLMDKEENTQEMAAKCDWPLQITHIQALEDLPSALRELSRVFESGALQTQMALWEKIVNAPSRPCPEPEHLPGLLQWWNRPEILNQCIYVIWRRPWMAAQGSCFIASVCNKLGLSLVAMGSDKYPVFDPEALRATGVSFLLSSEPYPFGKWQGRLGELGDAPQALIDGEKYSWFGLRSARFLAEQLFR